MKRIKLIGLLAAGYLLVAATPAQAAVVDMLDATNTPGPIGGTYFLPDDGTSAYSLPYFRYQDQSWGWQHNAIAGSISSASLSISAFDIDSISGIPDINPQVDEIQLRDVDSNWITLGPLLGSNNSLSTTPFDLGSDWNDEIAAGLQVRILIDTDNTYPSGNYSNPYWGVTLTKSVLSVKMDTPNPVPLPAAAWLFGTALLSLAGFRRRQTGA